MAAKALSNDQLEVAFSETETLDPQLAFSKDEAEHNAYDDIFKFTPEVMMSIRSGCLLKTTSEKFSFLHKSLIEYFAARGLFNSVHLAMDSYTEEFSQQQCLQIKLGSMNETDLKKEPQVVQMLAEKVKEHPHFKDCLYNVIEQSKTVPGISTAAANAITVLNVSGESFSGKVFGNIKIPGADLSGAVCDGTNFSGANVSRVIFREACLRQANFEEALMKETEFGELPYITHGYARSACIDPKGDWLLLQDDRDKLTRWSLHTLERKAEYQIFEYKYNIPLSSLKYDIGWIDKFNVSTDSLWIVIFCGDRNKVYLLDIQRGKVTKQLTLLSFGEVNQLVYCPDKGEKLFLVRCFKSEESFEIYNFAIQQRLFTFKGDNHGRMSINPHGDLLAYFEKDEKGTKLKLSNIVSTDSGWLQDLYEIVVPYSEWFSYAFSSNEKFFGATSPRQGRHYLC